MTYMEFHKGWLLSPISFPLRSKVMREVCMCEDDANFIDRVGSDLRLLVVVLIAANELEIHNLLCLCCAKIASLIKNQSPEKISELAKNMSPGYEIIADFPRETSDDIKEYWLQYVWKTLNILFPSMLNVVKIVCRYCV